MAFSKQWLVIINPTSGNGSSRKLWPKIKAFLIDSNFDFDYVFTEHAKQSIDLTQEAVALGINHIICVGGDGTLHNIVNGIMSVPNIIFSKVTVGVIPIGTGNDWVKTYNIPNDYKKAIEIIKNGNIKYQDVGRINFLKDPKNSIYFNNLAGIGFDGLVVSKVGKYKYLGALAYFIGAILGLFSFRNFKVKVSFNNQSFRFKSLMVLIGLCKYSGGGMLLTKNPDSIDGKFDISLAQHFTKLNVITNLTKLFNGKIVSYKKVKTFKTSSIKVEVEQNESPFIQADGELLGKGSFTASIMPKALAFYAK